MPPITTNSEKTIISISTTNDFVNYQFDVSQSDVTFFNNGSYPIELLIDTVPIRTHIVNVGMQIVLNDIEITGFSAKSIGDSILQVSSSPFENENPNIPEKLNKFASQLNDIVYQSHKETVIEVGTGKTFANVTDAINSINDNSEKKRYKILVYTGTYAERIILKPYIGVVGVDRVNTKFEWDRPLTTSDNDVSSDSMCELHQDGCYIKNLTITGSNFRYMVHTEFDTNIDRTVIVDNCTIIHKGNDAKYTWLYPHAIGSGLGKSNTKIIVKNSYLQGATNGYGLLTHDNASPTNASYIELDNNTILSTGGNIYEAVNFDNYTPNTGNIPWYVTMNNNKIQVGVLVSGAISRCNINGGNNSMLRYYASNWVDTSAGSVFKNTSGNTILKGTAVMISANARDITSVFDGTDTVNYERLLGITLEDIPNNSFGRICWKGYIDCLFNGTSLYLDDVILNSSGKFVKYDNTLVDYRPVIGKLISASAVDGQLKTISFKTDFKSEIQSSILLKGGNVKFYPWGGIPANAPNFTGQFAVDSVSGGIWFAKGTTTSDWIKLN